MANSWSGQQAWSTVAFWLAWGLGPALYPFANQPLRDRHWHGGGIPPDMTSPSSEILVCEAVAAFLAAGMLVVSPTARRRIEHWLLVLFSAVFWLRDIAFRDLLYSSPEYRYYLRDDFMFYVMLGFAPLVAIAPFVRFVRATRR